jgi:hypothetical protein
MIRVDLKRHGKPSAQLARAVLNKRWMYPYSGTIEGSLGASIDMPELLRRAVEEPIRTVITINVTDDETGRTIFLRGGLK